MNYLKLLPEYPRTRHLCYKPNASRLDLIATEEECKVIFESDNTDITEKVDGANCAICFFEDNPVIRNRSNILNKAKSGHLRTPAKIQFASIYNWSYENRLKFDDLYNYLGFEVSVFGEWLYATHSMRYDSLTCYFMPYDLYDWEKGHFIECRKAREALEAAGFTMPPLLHSGKVSSYEFLEKFMEEKSPFSSLDKREGLYIKVSDKEKVVERFKWVRHDFIQGERWDKGKITKNKVVK